MAVFRVERTGDYTVMSNFHLKDKRLSLKAKGLLSQMLSLPDDWDYTLSGLSYINRESKDAIRSAVNELETAGYIRRRQTTDASGKFAANEYTIFERPIEGEPMLDKQGPDIKRLLNRQRRVPTGTRLCLIISHFYGISLFMYGAFQRIPLSPSEPSATRRSWRSGLEWSGGQEQCPESSRPYRFSG